MIHGVTASRAYALPGGFICGRGFGKSWAIAQEINRRVRRCGAGVFAAAGTAQIGRRKNASGGGGPTTTPSWIAVGTADNTNVATATPAYGTNAAGDLFVMVVAGRITSVTTPTGWTLQAGPNAQSGRRCYIYTRDTRSTGSESGTVSVTMTANSAIAAIHTFRNVATSSFVEDVSTNGNAAGSSGVLPPAITAGGNFRLAVFACGSGTANTLADDIAGETGGTWVMRDEDLSASGNDAAYALYTAALASGGTITGGAGVVDTEEHSSVGFALVGV